MSTIAFIENPVTCRCYSPEVIAAAKEAAGADTALVVLTGDFTCEGYPAPYTLKERADAAVSGGADLAVVIPACGTLHSESISWFAGIALLQRSHCADELAVLYHNADPKQIYNLAMLLFMETPAFQSYYKGQKAKKASDEEALSNTCEHFIPGAAALLADPLNASAVRLLTASAKLYHPIKACMLDVSSLSTLHMPVSGGRQNAAAKEEVHSDRVTKESPGISKNDAANLCNQNEPTCPAAFDLWTPSPSFSAAQDRRMAEAFASVLPEDEYALRQLMEESYGCSASLQEKILANIDALRTAARFTDMIALLTDDVHTPEKLRLFAQRLAVGMRWKDISVSLLYTYIPYIPVLAVSEIGGAVAERLRDKTWSPAFFALPEEFRTAAAAPLAAPDEIFSGDESQRLLREIDVRSGRIYEALAQTE